MPNDDFTPDLTRLEHDYQILTELHRTHHSRTYLARHLGLNRDVTVTVLRAADGTDNSVLAQFSSDARTLTETRHANIVPVIEARWLGVDTLAVVRARVRGSTLDQVVAAGRMPALRVGETIAHVNSALEWARKHGITHRQVSLDNVMFQQGSGRVLLSFDPAVTAADISDDRCTDARTIGRLAWEMLAGQRADTAGATSLAEMRPELDPRIIEETNALMGCRPDGVVPDIAAFIAVLSGGAAAAPSVATPVVMKAPSVILPTAPRPASSRVNTDEPVVVVNRGMSFNARLGAAVAVFAVIGAMGLMLARRDSSVETPAMTTQVPDSSSEASGDVALRSKVDTSRFIAPPRRPAPEPNPMATSPQPTLSQPTSPTTASSTRRPTDSVPTVSIRPTAARPVPRDSVANVEVTGERCDSPASSDQHACLMDAIDKNDVELNRVYRRLIASLRRQAKVEEDADDPPAVTELRSAQFKWLEERDVMCRSVGSGALYARDRSQCFAEQSVKRTDELRKKIGEVPEDER